MITVSGGLVTSTLSTPGGPEGVAVSPDDTFAYVSVAGSAIYRIDLTNETVGVDPIVAEQDPVTGLYPFLTDVIFSPDGAFAYTTDNNNAHVLVIDVATSTVARILTVDGAYPNSLAITPNGSTVWVSFGQGPSGTEGIQPIDVATNTIGARVIIGDESTGLEGIAVSPSGNVIYVVNMYDGTVSIVGDPVLRVSGADRYETAIKVSQQAFPAGADAVLIATGANYPDALAAGPAAAHLEAPLLLTNPNTLPQAVKDEIVRLGPSNIVIVGGTGAVSPAVEASLNLLGATVTRVPGADRYETARAITSHAFGSNGGLLVYLATGSNFPDALSAGAAAAAIGVPVILVDGAASSIDQATLDLFTLLGTNRVRIAGGTGVVSSAIQTQLNGLFTAPNVHRDPGANRYETSVKIVKTAFSAPVTRALIATGVNFPDALAGAAWAGQINAPLFIVPGTCIPQGVLDEIQSLGIYQISLIGGTGALTSGVFNGTACK